MKTIFKIIIGLCGTALLVLAGFYFKSDLLNLYHGAQKNIEQFQKTELGEIINEFKREVLAPSPLNIGGKENQVILTKAKVIAETNIQRYDNDTLLPLVENVKLSAAAKAKADDMFKDQYFEHVSPSGVDPGELVKSAGYEYVVTGENLILGNFESEKELVQHWMDSPGHRANILNKRFTEIGVAMVKGVYKGETVWIGVQEFGLPLTACVQPQPQLKITIDQNKILVDTLALQIDAKRDEIEKTNKNSSRYNELVDEYNQLVAQYNTLIEQTKNMVAQYNAQINVFNQCVEGSGA